MAWHPDRDAALAAPLSALREHWVGIPCPCNRLVKIPCKLLAKRVGGTAILRDVLRRLRCEHCGAAPASAYLTDDPTGGVMGTKAWELGLVP